MEPLDSLLKGDENAFIALVEQYQSTLLRLASTYVADSAAAEEVVQETWIAVLKGLSRFEGRSSLKTWIFSILMNIARTRATRDGRYIYISMDDDDEPVVAPERFHPSHHEDAGHWADKPQTWENIPENHMLSAETQGVIAMTIDALPPSQRQVILLRDVEGWTAEEVCNVLGLTETNQRVLLHRARSRVRQALEDYFKDE